VPKGLGEKSGCVPRRPCKTSGINESRISDGPRNSGKLYNTIQPHGSTSLHVAATNGDAATVESLVVAGARLSIKDSNGATPLNLAIDDICYGILKDYAGAYAILIEYPTSLVSSILAHSAALPSAIEPVPTTALSLRAHQLDPSFRWALPAARAAVYSWARDAFIVQLAANTQPFEKLPEDCAGDVLDFFETALTRAEASHLTTHCSSPEASAWVCAIIVAAVVPIIAAGATTELILAAERGDETIVQDCLAKGADTDAHDTQNGSTALFKASEKSHTAIVNLLLEAGAGKAVSSRYGFTALMEASANGHTAIVQLLLQAEADMDASATFGETAFTMASSDGQTAIVKLLLEAGTYKEAKSGRGYTALMVAALYNRSATVKLLLKAGANKEATTPDGYTALMLASHSGHAAIVHLLLKVGSDTHAKNENGETALDCAKGRGHTEVVALLEN